MIMAHVSQAKKQELVKLNEILKGYKVVGILDLTGLPSAKLQQLKGKFRDRFSIRISKKSLMKFAFEKLDKDMKGISNLIAKLDEGIPALILANEDPFKLSKLLSKSRSNTFAKAGQVSPNDITIQAGPTSFGPGPAIGEFSSAGLKTAIEGGKIVIKEDKLFVKKGEEINAKKAEVLSKLGIEPIEISFKLIAMFENGKIFDHDILDINEQAYVDSLKESSQEAFNLAINIGYVSKETIEYLIKRAVVESEALSNAKNIKSDNVTSGG